MAVAYDPGLLTVPWKEKFSVKSGPFGNRPARPANPTQINKTSRVILMTVKRLFARIATFDDRIFKISQKVKQKTRI